MSPKPTTVHELNTGVAEILDATPGLTVVENEQGPILEPHDDAYTELGYNHAVDQQSAERMRRFLEGGHATVAVQQVVEQPVVDAPIDPVDRQKPDLTDVREKLKAGSARKWEPGESKVTKPIAKAYQELGKRNLPGIQAEVRATIERDKQKQKRYPAQRWAS